jgi:hypothetical protein
VSSTNGVTLAIKNTTGTTGGTEFCQLTFNNTSNANANFESAKIKAISTNGGSNLAHLTFENSGSERARITSAGNLLVGTTSVAASCKTTIATASNSQLAIDCTTASGTVYSTIVFTQAQATKTQLYQDHGATRFYIVNNTNGLYLAANATAWTAVSDEREKENLVLISNAASKVASLRAVTGNYIFDETKKSRAFLIAQDLQAEFPEAVDATDPEKLGVQYTDVIPLLVAAIQEQQALITTLTDRITALEAKP